MRNNQRRLQDVQAPTPQPQSQAPGMVYAVPTDFVELPSRGMFYPADHPLCGKKTIEIKYMTAKEEDILSSATLIKNGLVIDRFLESIIVDTAIDPKTLLVGDRNAMMVASRSTAYGYGYDLNVVCNDCDRKSTYTFDLTKSKMVENCFDDEFLKLINCSYNKEKCSYEINLPISNILVGVKLLTGADLLDSIDLDENLVTNILSQFVVSVNGDMTPAIVKDFIQNMPAGDSKFLRDRYMKLVPNIDLTQGFFCNHCGASEDKEVPLSAEFFWPK